MCGLVRLLNLGLISTALAALLVVCVPEAIAQQSQTTQPDQPQQQNQNTGFASAGVSISFQTAGGLRWTPKSRQKKCPI